jgi:L-idonate 5-dehydrogenase
MRAVVAHAAKDLRVEEAPAPELGSHDIGVRIGFGGICGSDLHYYNHGGFGVVRLREPMILGHEVAGVIEAVGTEATRVKVGDRIAVNPSVPCNRCRYCLEGLQNQCLDMRFYGSAMRMPHVQGAFRDALVCDASQCVAVAPGVAFELAALAEPFAVALHAVARAGPLLGRHVLVSGCGPIGALVVAAARLHGAAEIVATDVVAAPLAVARAVGASRTIDVGADTGWVERYSADKGYFDTMIECSGNERALRDGLAVMRPRGTVVQLGLGGDVSLPQNVVVAKELSICGSFRFHAEFALAVQLINEQRVDLRPLVTRAFALREARAAFDLAGDRRQAMKVLIDFAA